MVWRLRKETVNKQRYNLRRPADGSLLTALAMGLAVYRTMAKNGGDFDAVGRHFRDLTESRKRYKRRADDVRRRQAECDFGKQ